MATCYEPLTTPLQRLPHSPCQAPPSSCVGLLHDVTSSRTFRIPDIPATSSVAHIKHWYAKNVASADPRHLVVSYNGRPLEDAMQVWQLAQGQGQFAISVSQAQTSPRSILNIYVETNLQTPPLALQISSDSTILYVKQRIFEMIDLPMALATSPHTALFLPPANAPLHNSHTLAESNVLSNSRLSLSFSQQDLATASSPMPSSSSQQQFSRIKHIWSAEPKATNSPLKDPSSHGLLPSTLLEDDEDDVASTSSCGSHCSDGSRPCGENQNAPIRCTPNRGRSGRRSHSPPGDRLSSAELQQLAANFRTKLCRNGRGCKFGRNCWFAHNAEELRKPTDPLPNNLPAVHKLERYSHREATSKERQN